MTGSYAASSERLPSLLRDHGLLVLARVNLDPALDAGWLQGAERVSRAVLVGNAGSAMWKAFRASPEFGDGRPDPLDRWSRRVGTFVAGEIGAQAVYPFDGPPHPPFLDLAKRGGAVFTSPLSMAIHTRYGLWHAYRFLLLLEGRTALPAPGASPCVDCREQPCLHSCPVDAFSPGRYRVQDCVAYLEENERSSCRERGCAARRACPVAPEGQYEPEHARFHMEAFLRAMRGPAPDLD